MAQDSYIELLRSFNYTPRNFKVTRNVPIDTRFLVTDINNIDIEIPEAIRYPGLIFFVKNSNVNDGTTINIDGTKKLGSLTEGIYKINGILYIFDDNLQPIPLHDLIERFEIRLLKINDSTDTCYSKLIDETNTSNETNSLNHIFAKIGNIVFIEPLGIAVICRLINNKPTWQYLAGSYNVLNEDQFYSIDESLRQPNAVVNLNGSTKIITSNRELSDEIIKANSISDCSENNRFYNINDFIYYHIAGLIIPVSNKFVTKTINLQKGDNINIIDLKIDPDNVNATIFDSNFNTRNIIVDCIIGDQGDEYLNNLYKDFRLPLQHKIIDNNTINIISSIDVKNVTLIIRANE